MLAIERLQKKLKQVPGSLKRVPLKQACYVALITVLPFCTFAQTVSSVQYYYDDLGELTKVVDSTGTVIEYVYDPVGNILQIKRSSIAPGTLAIFNFTPQRGGPGQTVIIQGQAFDPTLSKNIVQFNGTAATVLSASPTTLTVTVPTQATTGPISVTVAGQTATSTINFTVLPVPVITSLSRKSALLGATFPNARFPGLTVSGLNLTDSIFALAPATSPPAATFGAPAIDSTGTSATASLTVGTATTGTFAVVATNFVGSSTSVITSANRFTIVDPRSTADTDGDGVPDAVEAIYGTDPLDATSFPLIPSLPGQALSAPFTVLNQNARTAPNVVEAESPAFTVLNGSAAQKNHEAESSAFVVLNSNSQVKTFEAESPAFSLLNGSAAQGSHEAESPLFTLLNGTPSQTSREAESPVFTVNNFSPSAAGEIAAPILATQPQSHKTQDHGAHAQTKKPTPKNAAFHKTSKKGQGAVSTVPGRTSGPVVSSSSDKNSTESGSQQGATHANQK